MEQKFTTVFERCEEGGFHAFFKELPGVHSQGQSIQEAQNNLIDALNEMLAYRIEEQLAGKDASKIDHLETFQLWSLPARMIK